MTRIPATGGAATIAAQFDVARESNQSIVGALADGRLLVSSQAGLFVASEGGSRILTSEITMPAALFHAMRPDGTPADVIVFIRNGRLMAQALDDSATLEGSPVELAQDASQLVAPAARPFSAGGDVLAFVARSGIETRPTWVDRRGRVLGPAASVTGQMRDVRLSPDASRLSVSRLAAGSSFELLLVDLRRDTVSRPTLGLSVSQAYWYRDGQSLVGVLQEGPATRAIVRIPASEGGTPEPLLRTTDVIPTSPAFHRMANTSPTPASTTGEVSTSTFAGCPERARCRPSSPTPATRRAPASRRMDAGLCTTRTRAAS